MFLLTFVELQQKGRSNKKNKKKKRLRTLGKEITLAQAQQQMFGGYYKVIAIITVFNFNSNFINSTFE